MIGQFFVNVDLFTEIALIMVIVTLISLIMRLFKQPPLIGYILSGVVLGPSMLNLMLSINVIQTLSQIGVALLLFIIGLSLNPKVFKDSGKNIVKIGIMQVALTFFLGFVLCTLLKIPFTESILLAVALSFSSTVIVSKVLFDRNEVDTFYGRMSMGILLVQDIVAVFLLMLLPPLYENFSVSIFPLFIFLRGVGLLFVLFSISYLIFPRVGKFMIKSPEMLFLFSISWCLSLASIFEHLGFSLEIGALLAGMTMYLMPFHFEAVVKIRPLQDFFIILFFILVGTNINPLFLVNYIHVVLLLLLFTILIKPLIIMFLMGMSGYTKRNTFLTAISLSQTSEFSLIFLSLAFSLGRVSLFSIQLISAISLVSFATSTYLMSHSKELYSRVSRQLSIFEKRGRKIDEYRRRDGYEYEIALFGCGRIGHDILGALKRIGKRFVVVDFNPEVISMLVKTGVECRFGDANDLEFLNELNFRSLKMLVSTIPDFDTNSLLLTRIREVNKNAIVIMVSHRIEEAVKLYDMGATYVIMPHFLGGYKAATMIEEYAFDIKKFVEEKGRHLNHIMKRRAMGHEHPRVEEHG